MSNDYYVPVSVEVMREVMNWCYESWNESYMVKNGVMNPVCCLYLYDLSCRFRCRTRQET